MPYITAAVAPNQIKLQHETKGPHIEHLFDQDPSPATLRSAWFILLARYSQSESIEVQTTSIGDSDTNSSDVESSGTPLGLEPLELALPFDRPLKSFLREIETTTSETCFTSGNVNTFPLAANNGFRHSDIFRTAVFSCNSVEDSNFSSELSDYHIVLKHYDRKVSLWIDNRLSSTTHDPGLPARLLAQLKFIVLQLSTLTSDLTIGDIDFMTEVDLKDSHAHMAPMPPAENSLLHELVMRNAQRIPNAPALCAWDGNLTYAEFDTLTKSLALKLRAAGVTVGTFVPVITEKSVWALVSMIAINRAGGAFVTLVSTIISASIELTSNFLLAVRNACSAHEVNRRPTWHC